MGKMICNRVYVLTVTVASELPGPTMFAKQSTK